MQHLTAPPKKKIEHSRPGACNYVDQDVIYLKREYLSHF